MNTYPFRFPKWYWSFIARKHGLDAPGKYLIDQAMKGIGPSTIFTPAAPTYLSNANISVLMEATLYSAGNSERREHVRYIVLNVLHYGVFPDANTANRFVEEAKKRGVLCPDDASTYTLKQPFWSGMDEKERSSVIVPKDYVWELVTNIGGAYIMCFIVATVVLIVLAKLFF